MFQTKGEEVIKTHFMFNKLFSENRVIYEIMWKNIVKRGSPQMTVRGMGIACWITKVTHTLAVSNTFCFSTVITFALTRLSVTKYAYWLSCTPWL
jgi:hypothetical protein